MPGLSLVFSSGIDKQALESALPDLESDGVSSAGVLYKDENLALVFSGHEGYPHSYHEDEDHVILIEGLIYNRAVVETDDAAAEIARILSRGGSAEKEVRDFTAASDGDFLCAVYSKQTASLLVFNDHLGRLHSFYHSSPDLFVLSREMKFLLRFMPEISVDRYGLALFMMFEYTLGDITLFRDAKRLLPSRMVHARFVHDTDRDSLQVTHNVSQPLDFDETGEKSSKASCIERLAPLYMESLENRYSLCRELGYSCIADVSGGFDTRSIMMGLEKIGADAGYFTHELVSGDESRVALELGEVYGKPVRTVSASHDLDYEELERLTYASDCMVNGWTALTSWRDSRRKRDMLDGKIVSFMGFGGEFIRHPFHPARGFNSLQTMLGANLLKSPLTADWAGFLAGIPYEKFIGTIEAYFETYPEQTLAGKLKRLYFEYYNVLVNAGEDRTRHLFWTVQPLWGKEMYAYEMNEVPLQYAHFSFYAAFMGALDPKALSVPVYGSRIRLDSGLSLKLYDVSADIRYHVRNAVLSNRFTNSLYFRLRGRDRRTEAFIKAAEVAFEVHRKLKCLSGCIPEDRIERFVNSGYGTRNMHRLVTVMLYFKQVEERFGGKLTV